MQPVTVTRRCMGSTFSIQAYPDGPRQTNEMLLAALGLAFAEIVRVEELLSDFRPSPFNEINKLAGIKPVKVPREIVSLVELSRKVSRETNGAFDISYASVGMLWREAFKTGVPPETGAVEKAAALVDYRKIEVDPERCEIFLPRKGMRVGLGSIGKSYGVDRAYGILKRLGVNNFFVNGAGDIRASSGAGAPRPWRIGIKNPFRNDETACGVLLISNGAVVTSGDYERCVTYAGKRYHHIMDARTSRIRDDISSVTVLCPNATLANAYATSVIALGVDDGAAFLLKKADVRGIIIKTGGEVVKCNMDGHAEPGLKAYGYGRAPVAGEAVYVI